MSTSESDFEENGNGRRRSSRLMRVQRVPYYVDPLTRRKALQHATRNNTPPTVVADAPTPLPDLVKRPKAIQQGASATPSTIVPTTSRAANLEWESFVPKLPPNIPHVDLLSIEILQQRKAAKKRGKFKSQFFGALSTKKNPFSFGSKWNYLLPSGDAKHSVPWAIDPARPPPDLDIKINSIVVSTRLGSEVDLMRMASYGTCIHYNPVVFKGITMRLTKFPQTSVLVFQSGYMVLCGEKSVEDSYAATKAAYTKLVKWGAKGPRRFQLCVNNISATVRLDFRIRIAALLADGARQAMTPVQVDPHSFTGVSLTVNIATGASPTTLGKNTETLNIGDLANIICAPKTSCTVVAFATGSLLITGITDEADIKTVIERVYPVFKMYAM